MEPGPVEARDPVPLFRPELGEQPPADAIDVYMDPPVSVSKLWWLAGEDLPPERAERLRGHLAQWRAQAVTGALSELQRSGGWIKAGTHHLNSRSFNPRAAPPRPARLQWERTFGIHQQAQLEVTPISHNEVDGSSGPASHWLHEHIYIGRTAEALDGSGRWPLDLGTLREATLWARMAYIAWLKECSTGLKWARHPLTDELEIVYPGVDEDLEDQRGADVWCIGAGVPATIRPSEPGGGNAPRYRGE